MMRLHKITYVLLIIFFLLACQKSSGTQTEQPGSPSFTVAIIQETKTDQSQSSTSDRINSNDAYVYPEWNEISDYPYPYSNMSTYPSQEINDLDENLDISEANSPYPNVDVQTPYPVDASEAYPYPYPNPSEQSASYSLPDQKNSQSPEKSILEPTINAPMPTLSPIPLVIKERLIATDPTTFKIRSGKIQFVMFFAFWDGTSKAMAPILFKLEAEYIDKINFVYLDIDDPAVDPFKILLKFRFQPHFFLVNKEGQILKNWIGFVEEKEIREELDKAIYLDKNY